MLVTNTRGPLLCKRGASFLPVVWQELSNPADFLKQPKVKAGLDPNRWENGSAATVIQPMDFDGPSHGAGNWSALVGVKKRRPFRGDAVQSKFQRLYYLRFLCPR
jgi:hypothetical protein